MAEKKAVLVTGAAGGIGRAVVERFQQSGWLVVGVDRQEYGSGFPKDGLFICSDISNEKEISAIFEKISGFLKTLHALVNNAAIQIAKPFMDLTVEDWDQTMGSNLRSVFLGVKFAHPLLKAAKGAAIVNVSSIHAIATSANISAYAASKGGLLALTRALAIEFAPENIRVNAVLPGAVDTPMLRESMNRGFFGKSSIEERLNALAGKTVNGRVAAPMEIANAIYFLADGEQSSFMTGQALVVDGGASARLSTE
jgi:NAD(P)-dependent dehydrogenase (short-subunit alcohol dehydrogenase family)